MSAVSKSVKKYSNFDPRYMSGCILWLDGNDTSTNSMTITGSIPFTITTWKDKSGNGNNATSSGSPYSGQINSSDNSYVYLDSGSSSYFSGSLSITGNSFTSFAVAKLTTVPSASERRLLGFANVGSSLQDDSSASTCVPAFVDSGGNILQTKRNSPGTNFCMTNISSGTKFMVSTVYNGSNGNLYTNGNLPGGTGTSSGNFNIANYSVGAKIISVGNYWIGQIGEVIVYNRGLLSYERQQVEGYLGEKWGLGSSLVGGHPYITRNPVLSAFNPTNFGNCVLWIDASDARYFTLSGSNVLTLSDKSGVSDIGVKYGTPTWSATGLDGVRPAFGTDVGAFVFTLGSLLTTYRNTVFIVTKLDTAPVAGSCAVGLSSSATGATTYYRCLDYTSSRFRVVMDFGTLYVNSGTIGPVVGSSFLYSSTYNGSTGTPAIRNYLKGGTQSDSINVSTNPPSSDATYCMIGCDSFTFTGGTTPFYWKNGKIAEVLVFDDVLSDTNRQLIDSYLSYKWGLQADMPSSNPNKNFPPLTIT